MRPARDARAAKPPQPHPVARPTLAVETEPVTAEEAREAGPVHFGHRMWQQLGLSEMLSRAGLSDRAGRLSEAMTLNRLIFPLSEHAMPDWMRRTALAGILQTDFSALHDDALYRNLDRLHPSGEGIERELAEREKTLNPLQIHHFTQPSAEVGLTTGSVATWTTTRSSWLFLVSA